MAKKNDLKNSMSGGLMGGLDGLIQSTSGKQEKPEKEKAVHCNFVMNEMFHKKLKVIAVRKSMTLKEALQEAITDYLEKNKGLID